MKREKEFAILAEALSKSSITTINEACRLILKERLEAIVCSDKEVQKLTEKIISGFSPSIEMNIIKREKSHKMPPSKNKKIVYGILGGVGLLIATLYNNSSNAITDNIRPIFEFSWMRLFGCAAFGFAIAMGVLMKERSREIKETTYQCEIKQKVEDIINELDLIFDSLKRLLMHNQLETQYSPILKWLQNLWAESDNDLQTDICKLLSRINYEIVDYSADLSDYFDANSSPGIDEPKTTRPALRNKMTGDIIARGYVIIPMKTIN